MASYTLSLHDALPICNSRCSEVLTVLEARDRGVEARVGVAVLAGLVVCGHRDRNSTRVNSSHANSADAVVRVEENDHEGDAAVRNRTRGCPRRRGARV